MITHNKREKLRNFMSVSRDYQVFETDVVRRRKTSGSSI